MGLIDRMRGFVTGNDAGVVRSLQERAQAQREAAAAAQVARVAELPAAYASQSADTVAHKLAQELGRGPVPGEDPAVAMARQTLLSLLGGDDYADAPSRVMRGMRSEAGVKQLASELGDWGAGAPSANAARNVEIAKALAVIQGSRAGGFQRGMAQLNERIAKDPWARTAAYSGMVGGSLAGAAGLTPAAMELLKLAGLVGPEDEQPMG